jgi:hypothetical protein
MVQYLHAFYHDQATNIMWVYRIGSNGDLSRGKLRGDGYKTVLACHAPTPVLKNLDYLMAQTWWRDTTLPDVPKPVQENDSDEGLTWAEFKTTVTRVYPGAFWNDSRKRFQIKTLNWDGSYSVDDIPSRMLQRLAYNHKYFGDIPGAT